MTTCGMGRNATRLRNGLLMAVSALVLNGCVSASGDMQSEDNAALAETTSGQQEQAQGDAGADGYRDPMVNAGRGDGPSAQSGAGSAPSEPPNLADAIMQPAQVNASQTSIFASAAPAAASEDAEGAPGAGPEPSGRAITNLYQANPGASPAGGGETTGSIPATPGSLVTPGAVPASDEEASVVPDHVPVPTSVRSALVAEGEGNDAQRALAATAAGGTLATETAAASGIGDGDKPAGDPETRLTLAALFAAKRKTAGSDQAEKPAPVRKTRVLNRETAGGYQTASLAHPALPGVAIVPTPAPGDHTELEEDAPDDADDNGGVTEVASLAGLARLSPNGVDTLLTITDSTGIL